MNAIVEKAIQHWQYIAPLVTLPQNDAEFEQLLANLDALLDSVGDDERHPLMGLVDILSATVSTYEAERVAEPLGKGIDALHYLMTAHGLRQTDLPEIGSQGVVSEILSGRRDLNLRQIKALAARFGVSTATFID